MLKKRAIKIILVLFILFSLMHKESFAVSQAEFTPAPNQECSVDFNLQEEGHDHDHQKCDSSAHHFCHIPFLISISNFTTYENKEDKKISSLLKHYLSNDPHTFLKPPIFS